MQTNKQKRINDYHLPLRSWSLPYIQNPMVLCQGFAGDSQLIKIQSVAPFHPHQLFPKVSIPDIRHEVLQPTHTIALFISVMLLRNHRRQISGVEISPAQIIS